MIITISLNFTVAGYLYVPIWKACGRHLVSIVIAGLILSSWALVARLIALRFPEFFSRQGVHQLPHVSVSSKTR